mgnify:CR=1 FL=1
MAGLLRFSSGRSFASGVARYLIGTPGQPWAGRMMISLLLEKQPIIAVIDTGAPFFVCHPGLSSSLALSLTDPLEDITLKIRGQAFQGTLYLLSITIPAETGDNLDLPSTVFIPRLPSDDLWRFPSFIGLDTLQRMRFAVDPDASLFYFGPLGEA